MVNQEDIPLPPKLRYLFNPKFWKKAIRKFMKIIEKLDSQTGQSINLDILQKRDITFLKRFRDDVEKFVDTLVVLRWASSCTFIKDDEKIAKALERLDIQTKRRIRRIKASKLMDDLGCSRWNYSDLYYDNLGIKWMHAGRWGEDEPY
ncbi:hypothetical protein PV327_001992 [Microctonus hyperodae]|uniref:Uncharacterized protein n=1 Tax=Microctonus hyperodae TaxID=165561 RepID=A0AA39FEM3_MICHY|nr:hypothetical protein PV327_001992 [Microctonus hyperodae]